MVRTPGLFCNTEPMETHIGQHATVTCTMITIASLLVRIFLLNPVQLRFIWLLHSRYYEDNQYWLGYSVLVARAHDSGHQPVGKFLSDALKAVQIGGRLINHSKLTFFCLTKFL